MALTRAEGTRRRPAGFTIIEVLVAVVFLTVVAVSLGAMTQQATRTIRRSRTELGAAEFLETEVERLRLLDYDSVVSGKASRGRGIAIWTVEDSVTFRRVLLETRFGTPASGLIVDSVTLFRVR